MPSQTKTEALYDFKIDIRESTIPGGGLGAFLTYLGASVLRKATRDRSKRLLQQHVAANDIIDTHNPLEAEIDGRKMSVSLNGNNLNYNDNVMYWPAGFATEFARSEKRKKGSFDEGKVKCKVYKKVKKLRQDNHSGGLGFLGIHKKEDYR